MARLPRHALSGHPTRFCSVPLLSIGYKRMASMRRSIGVSAVVQLAYICARTLWHSIPFLTGGERRLLGGGWAQCNGCRLPLHAQAAALPTCPPHARQPRHSIVQLRAKQPPAEPCLALPKSCIRTCHTHVAAALPA